MGWSKYNFEKKLFKKIGKQIYLKNKKRQKCERKGHIPTGQWSVRDGKSFAICQRCGEYETTLMQKK